MKAQILMSLSLTLALQASVQAQPQQQAQPSLEVQVQQLPSYAEGNFYDNSGRPQRDFPQNGGPNRPYQNNQNVQGSYSRQSSSEWQINQTNSNQAASRVQSTPMNSQKPVEGVELTLSIIKPDAVRNKNIGDIISRFEKAGLRIAAIKMTTLNKEQAARFYQVHRDRPFYRDLVNYMSSGPVVIMVLEGDQAIAKNRELMGSTDPKKAEKGTIRADFGESVSQNAVHGSDSPETAREEVFFFFQPQEISRP